MGTLLFFRQRSPFFLCSTYDRTKTSVAYPKLSFEQKKKHTLIKLLLFVKWTVLGQLMKRTQPRASAVLEG